MSIISQKGQISWEKNVLVSRQNGRWQLKLTEHLVRPELFKSFSSFNSPHSSDVGTHFTISEKQNLFKITQRIRGRVPIRNPGWPPPEPALATLSGGGHLCGEGSGPLLRKNDGAWRGELTRARALSRRKGYGLGSATAQLELRGASASGTGGLRGKSA